MSHTTAISAVVITDAQALHSAINELKSKGVNCDLLEKATPRAYYPNQDGMGEADYVVQLHDAKYDIGLYYNEELKGMEARTDLHGGSVAKVMGVKVSSGENASQAAIGKLYNMYAIHAATREAARSGYQVQRIDNKDGSVQLRLTA